MATSNPKTQKDPKIQIESTDSNREIFDAWMQSSGAKTFALSSSKYNIGKTLFERCANGDYEEIDGFYRELMKTYFYQDRPYLDQFVDYQKNGLRPNRALKVKFVNDFLTNNALIFSEKRVDVDSFLPKVFDAVAEEYVLRLQQMFGPCIPEILIKSASCAPVRKRVERVLEENHYKKSNVNSNFYVSDIEIKPGEDAKIPDKKAFLKDCQEDLLKAYKQIVETMLNPQHQQQNIAQILKRGEEFWNVVAKSLDFIEQNLTEQSKKHVFETKNAIRTIVNFSRTSVSYQQLHDHKERFFKGHVREFVNNQKIDFDAKQKYSKYEKAISKVRSLKDKASEKDQKTVEEFFGVANNIIKALKVENGVCYPLNYYLVTKINPNDMKRLFVMVENSSIGTKEQREIATQAKYSIYRIIGNNNFDMTSNSSLEDMLTGHRMKITTSDGQSFDYTQPEQYAELVENVKKIMTKYDLPYNKFAINYAASAATRHKPPVDEKFYRSLNDEKTKE